MHYLTVFSDSNVVVEYRVDQSDPQHWDAESINASVSENRGISSDSIKTFEFANGPEMEPGLTGPIYPEMHIFDGVVRVNPNYVDPVVEKRFSLNDVISNLSLAEKSKFINRKTDAVITAIEEFKTSRNEVDTREILKFLVDAGDISQTSMNKILM
jgi:hypothetical protein